ncbi:hypothetical protein IOD16_02360 [Saccharothrix sp. 6-C]|uniref:hypothetical protein n=1 Tax=Saccharothrix sp. 6-C TaxID=2781735 RepID=UPI0019178260|nr:hypothetical protein [Saccharothrix sp. 6-C]QQQ77405.1 hypothetical protein IOD16_02360 [Saccharothrix sp. 6-C]
MTDDTTGNPTEVIDDDIRGFWKPPAPRELPALRAALAEHMRNPFNLEMTARTLAAGKGALIPPGPPHQAAATLLADEHRRLRAAQLYYVTEEMTELARVAGAGLPDHRLHRDDLPSSGGFVQFASPIGGYVSDDEGMGPRRTHIVACSWGDTTMKTSRDGVWLTFWCPVNTSWLAELFVHTEGYSQTDAERVVRATHTELLWDNEAFVPFDGEDRVGLIAANRDVTDQVDPSQSIAPWIQTVRAAWLLMTQPGITDVEHQRLPRQQQRRAARDGYPASDVHVVRLRTHPAADRDTDGNGGGPRAYTVRWMVRGHWRQQPHGPNRSLRRPVWINPHLKGPADAPLATTEKVYLVDRAPDPTS